MTAALLLLALVGHAFLWIGLVNRLHAVGARRSIIKLATIGYFLCAVLILIGIGWWCVWRFAADDGKLGLVIAAYVAVCWAVAPVTLLRFLWLRVVRRPPAILRFHGRRRAEINPASAAGEPAHHWLTRLPLNEILQLEVSQWVLDLPRLPPKLDGLSIVHLSDLHFTGRVGKAYFREVVRVSNELQPDLVCLTGDMVDRTACLDWIPDTLGRLTARHGVYFILGNHDRRVGAGRLRRMLEHNGLVSVGGRWLSIEISGAPVLLAGNEEPWFDGGFREVHAAPERPPIAMGGCLGSGSHALRGNLLVPTLRVEPSDAERRRQCVPTQSVGTRG
jgi:uncharacterized protein